MNKASIKQISYMGNNFSQYAGKEGANETGNANPNWMLMKVKYENSKEGDDWYLLYEKNANGKWVRNKSGSAPIASYYLFSSELYKNK